jgi:hypothetical protein
MHETIVHKTASFFMKTASFLILKHEHFYVMRFMQVGFLALEHLLPPTSFHHSSNSSFVIIATILLAFNFKFAATCDACTSC